MKWLRYMDDHLEEIFAVILFTLMTSLIFLQVIFRELSGWEFLNDYFGIRVGSLDWTEELGRYTFIWLVYFSASLAVKNDRHLRIEFFETIMPGKLKKVYSLLAKTVWLAFSIFMIYQGFDVAYHILQKGQTSPVIHLTMGYVYMIIPIGFALMSFRIIQSIIKQIRFE